MNQVNEIAVLGGGCFWCTEAVFRQLKGVQSVTTGYAGGRTDHPTYEQLHGGETGHAEVIQVEFDPTQISYDDLLTVFFATHNPTSLNRQGADVGTQYRSIILSTSEEQKEKAQAFIKKLDEGKEMGQPVVTEIKSLETFYPAEEYHQRYFEKNPDKGYCQFTINPKLEKVKVRFKELLR